MNEQFDLWEYIKECLRDMFYVLGSLVIIGILISALFGCSRRVSKTIETDSKTIVHTEGFDSTYWERRMNDSIFKYRSLFENIRRNESRTDSTHVSDSTRVVEHADGTTDTYHSRVEYRYVKDSEYEERITHLVDSIREDRYVIDSLERCIQQKDSLFDSFVNTEVEVREKASLWSRVGSSAFLLASLTFLVAIAFIFIERRLKR